MSVVQAIVWAELAVILFPFALLSGTFALIALLIFFTAPFNFGKEFREWMLSKKRNPK